MNPENVLRSFDDDDQDGQTSSSDCTIVYTGPSDEPPAMDIDDCCVYDGRVTPAAGE